MCRIAACLRAGPSAGLSWAGTQNDENDMVEHATFKNDSLPFEAAVPSSFSRNASARASKHSSMVSDGDLRGQGPGIQGKRQHRVSD